MTALFLDSEAISRLAERPAGLGSVHAALVAARKTGSSVCIPASVLSEQYRGGRFNKRLDSLLARNPQIEVIDTDRTLARTIGAVLASRGLGSKHHVDATLVAAALSYGPSVIMTSDPGDIANLVGDIPGIDIEAVR